MTLFNCHFFVSRRTLALCALIVALVQCHRQLTDSLEQRREKGGLLGNGTFFYESTISNNHDTGIIVTHQVYVDHIRVGNAL